VGSVGACCLVVGWLFLELLAGWILSLWCGVERGASIINHESGVPATVNHQPEGQLQMTIMDGIDPQVVLSGQLSNHCLTVPATARRPDSGSSTPSARNRRLSSKQQHEIVTAFHAGGSIRGLSRTFKVHRCTIHDVLDRAGIERSPAQLALSPAITPSWVSYRARRLHPARSEAILGRTSHTRIQLRRSH